MYGIIPARNTVHLPFIRVWSGPTLNTHHRMKPTNLKACVPHPFLPHAHRQVLRAYAGKHWLAIEQHLHDVLGSQAAKAGDHVQAARHFMALLQVCVCVRVCQYVSAHAVCVHVCVRVCVHVLELECMCVCRTAMAAMQIRIFCMLHCCMCEEREQSAKSYVSTYTMCFP
jgi:hypothetical protein